MCKQNTHIGKTTQIGQLLKIKSFIFYIMNLLQINGDENVSKLMGKGITNLEQIASIILEWNVSIYNPLSHQ